MLNNIHLPAQSIDSLRNVLLHITKSKEATLGISIIGKNGEDTLSINGDTKVPMQSVFKFPIAIAILSEIDKGRLSLTQKIKITKDQMPQNTWSPLRDTYPDGTTLPLSEIIRFTVVQSDNIGCDILLKVLGGTSKVESFFHSLHIEDISIKATEEEMHQSWEVQFQNWITPKTASELLDRFYNNRQNLLSQKSHDYLWHLMTETTTGAYRIKAGLPIGTVIAHRPGTSDTNAERITAAINDIGIILLPGGKYFILSVFITHSGESPETNDKMIADISKAAWNYFNHKSK